MRAVFYERFGGSEVLNVGERPTPQPAAGEVLIRVRAAGVNPIDWKLREGFAEGLFPYEFPIIPGWDAAGEIAALGADTVGFQPGDAVFTYCRRPLLHWGSYAEFVPVDARHVAPKPQHLSMTQAAAIPLAALTAWQALVDAAAVAPGQHVLVHAGAGGVGSFAIPIAKHLGATVLTTASAGNADYVRGLGADIVIDYRTQDWAAAAKRHCPDGVDMVLECLGGAVPLQSLDIIKKGGIMVCLNEPIAADAADARGIRHHRMFVSPDGEDLREIARLLDNGVLPVPPVEVLPFAQATRALDLNQAGHIRGKLALELA